MMECLHGEGHMYATDVDQEESAKTRKRLAEQGFGEEILTVKLQNFCTIDEIAKEADRFDFILADLGVSSMQIAFIVLSYKVAKCLLKVINSFFSSSLIALYWTFPDLIFSYKLEAISIFLKYSFTDLLLEPKDAFIKSENTIIFFACTEDDFKIGDTLLLSKS